jgi:hypothetical protein
MDATCPGTWTPFKMVLDADGSVIPPEDGQLLVVESAGDLTGSQHQDSKGNPISSNGKGECRPHPDMTRRIMTLRFTENNFNYFLRGETKEVSGGSIVTGCFIRFATLPQVRDGELVFDDPGDTGTWQGQQTVTDSQASKRKAGRRR